MVLLENPQVKHEGSFYPMLSLPPQPPELVFIVITPLTRETPFGHHC